MIARKFRNSVKNLATGLSTSFIVASAVFLAAPAHAYIPPASFILSETLKKHEDVKTIVMDGVVTDLRTKQSLREVLRIDFGTGRMTAAYFNENEPMGVYDSNVKDIHRLGKFWIGLGIDPSRERFHEALEELNAVPSAETVVQLTRIGNRVTWSWGENPFIAFFKDQFLPNEYLSGGKSANSEGILLNDYTSASSDTRVPKEVVIKVEGKEIYQYVVKTVKLNQNLKLTQAASTLKSPLAKDWVTLVR